MDSPIEMRYLYADVLIALAQQDNHVDSRERELLDGIFQKMGLDLERLRVLWLTPRTLDVVEAMVAQIESDAFKRCLLKDCYLLAHADESLAPEESRFIAALSGVLKIPCDTRNRIRAWVETGIEQQKVAAELFGE
ncbi:MAG TPA: hypothetical protein DCR55_07865 [Lentisphaeria bacterium]|jgi:uncharacterized membrane protein YebE (DUF533 family)|nr:hypothetical protein [Lentisphaeria bacterium]